MGGSFAAPPRYAQEQLKPEPIQFTATTTITITTTTTTNLNNVLVVKGESIKQMHEKLLDNDGCEAMSEKDKNDKTKSKQYKETKFTERLRRSFRRLEQNSFEVKRPEKTKTQERSSTSILKPLQKQLKSSVSIFSLTANLPGLGGHINPALLLDSPDPECTPPEYAYRHLSSVATTNSSTSLESNICESPSTSISYWAWHINHSNNNNMGNEISSGITTTTTTNNKNAKPLSVAGDLREYSMERDAENKRTAPPSAAAKSSSITESSRSCSTASDVTSKGAKLTRLQNLLSSKSSNESSKGFTISSFNSSSGEWENLCAFSSTTPNLTIEEDEEINEFTLSENHLKKLDSVAEDNVSEAGNYYQYTLASPSNPFLPEITARTYHSAYDEMSEFRELDEELDENVTSVKYRIGSYSAQMPTPNYSRAGSQESTHSDGVPHPHTASGSNRSSSSSSTPGRHKRKLFSLSTPNKLNFSQHQYQQHRFLQQQQQSSHSPVALTAGTTKTSSSRKSSTSSASLGRNLNPFNSSATMVTSPLPKRTSSGSNLNKRNRPLKQAAITSPTANVPLIKTTANTAKDLNARHEEFLRATTHICLVVSPPSTRLQLKSKSLTHLDGLQTEVIYNNTKSTNNIIANVATTHNTITTATLKTNSLLYSSLSPLTLPPPPSLLQYQIKQISLVPGRATSTSHHCHYFKNTKQASYSPQKFSNCLTPTIFTPSTTTTKSLSSILGVYSTITKSNTNITAAVSCCNRMYSARLGYTYPHCGCSALQPPSHHHYCKNTFQSDASTTTSYDPRTASAQGSSGNVYETPCVASAKTAIYLPPPSDGRVIPTSYKNKNSFLQRSKAMLAHSEVPNTEYFSVSFCTESTYQEDEFFPATKDVTLGIALSQALRRRNLSLSKVTITDTTNRTTNFLETESSFLNSSLDENTAVQHLAGHHLIITDKEGSRQTLHKANSFGSRGRPPGLFSGDSTDESSDPNLTGKQLKQRWSGLFGVKNPQQTQLCELLNNYSKNGVPQRTIALHNFENPQLDSAIAYLDNMHKSWRDIVECSQMSDGEIRIQTAIWELVTTEVDYIHCLQTVTDLFLACLESIQMEGLLQDVDQHRLFANIRDICEANLKFWTFHLYPMVSHSIITREPLRIGFFQTGFIQFAQMFAPYKKYCAEQSSCQFYCKELNRTNSLFTSYLAWCESQKMCNRLRLADILVRPMQRLTKYNLLLGAIKKHLTDLEEIEAVDIMLHATENFVFSVNNHLTTRQESERLKGVMARIESYDVVDTNNEQLDKIIKQYSEMFDLCGPMKGCAPHHVRHLFMEGDHKIKDIHGKADVHCFLLTDILLVCKSVAKKGLGTLKVIRQPYLTDRLIVHHSHNVLSCVYLNEFQVVTTAFTLHCSEAKNWYEALKRAKMIYTRLKQCLGTNGDNNIHYTGGGSIISGGTIDSLNVKKSPVNSSVCSHVTSANNSHSGSVEWNDSRNISADFEKTNSLSSDEGGSYLGVHGCPIKVKAITTISPQQFKIIPTLTSKTLTVQPLNHLVQSLPNLTLHNSQTNTLMVPSCGTNHSGTALLCASHRGISYPPPSPTRVPLRRAMAFSSSIKNPPLLKTRNITSQNSINWHQIPATPTPTTNPQYTLLNQPVNISTTSSSIASNTTANVTTTTQMNSLSCNTEVTLRDMVGKLALSNNQNLSSRLSTNSETDM